MNSLVKILSPYNFKLNGLSLFFLSACLTSAIKLLGGSSIIVFQLLRSNSSSNLKPYLVNSKGKPSKYKIKASNGDSSKVTANMTAKGNFSDCRSKYISS